MKRLPGTARDAEVEGEEGVAIYRTEGLRGRVKTIEDSCDKSCSKEFYGR